MKKSLQKANDKFSWPGWVSHPAVAFLDKSLSSGHLAQAYIFSGPSDLGKFVVARQFAANLMLSPGTPVSELERSSDFHVVAREQGKKNVSIDQIRELIRLLGLSAFGDSYKVAIIKEADLLSESAANALLKVLEEPRDKVVIILLVNHSDLLLKTLLSRGQLVRFSPVGFDVVYDYLLKERNASPSLAKNLARLAAGRPVRALHFFENADYYQSYLDVAKTFLDFFRQDFTARLAGVKKLISEIDKDDDQDIMISKEEVLDIWQSVARDLLLFNLDHRDLLSFEALREDIAKISYNLDNTQFWRHRILFIQEQLRYLRANVSFKNVLENIAANICDII